MTVTQNGNVAFISRTSRSGKVFESEIPYNPQKAVSFDITLSIDESGLYWVHLTGTHSIRHNVTESKEARAYIDAYLDLMGKRESKHI